MRDDHRRDVMGVPPLVGSGGGLVGVYTRAAACRSTEGERGNAPGEEGEGGRVPRSRDSQAGPLNLRQVRYAFTTVNGEDTYMY